MFGRQIIRAGTLYPAEKWNNESFVFIILTRVNSLNLSYKAIHSDARCQLGPLKVLALQILKMVLFYFLQILKLVLFYFMSSFFLTEHNI